MGLAGDRLLKYLDPIPVPAHVEPLKRRFMADVLLLGVNRSLQQGDVDGAREMMRHRYYPSVWGHPVRVLAHTALASLPSSLAKWSFEAGIAARRGIPPLPGRVSDATTPCRRRQSNLMNFVIEAAAYIED